MVSAALLYHSIGKRSARLQSLSFSLAVTGAVLHVIAQYAHWFREDVPDVSIAPLLSLCALVIIVILLLSSIGQRRFFAAGLVALPIAAVVLLLELFLPHKPFALNEISLGVATHVVSSVLAFGLLSIAGVYAFRSHHRARNHRGVALNCAPHETGAALQIARLQGTDCVPADACRAVCYRL